jgi:uncharacterized iron-regulated membrane protein
MGLCVVGLTLTGVLIWWKKRNSRKLIRQVKRTQFF